MASEPKGKMFVPVWVDAGIVKALISDTGTMPVTESSPLASIQAQLYGDMADTWYKVRVSAGRSLHTYIAGQAGDIEIKQLSPADIQTGLNTQIGGAWQKQPMIWGFSERLAQRLVHTKVSAGDYNMDFTTVPAGEVQVLNTVISRNSATASQQEYLIYDGTDWYPIYPYGTPGANVFRMSGYIQFVLKAGDRLRIVFRSCLNNDILTGMMWGYRMDIDL